MGAGHDFLVERSHEYQPSPLKKDPYHLSMSSDQEKGTTRSWPLRVFRKTDWFLEILNAFLSLLSLIGMIVLLANVHGRLLSSWVFVISPNAFLSVLSTTSKVCLILPTSECISQLKWLYLIKSNESNRYVVGVSLILSMSLTILSRLEHLQTFDNASRGPLDALKFICRSPSRLWLPWVGCVLTLLAIAVDPFTQQILKVELRMTEITDPPSYATASQVYDLGEFDSCAYAPLFRMTIVLLYRY